MMPSIPSDAATVKPTASENITSTANNNAAASSNLDVLLMAAAMVTSAAASDKPSIIKNDNGVNNNTAVAPTPTDVVGATRAPLPHQQQPITMSEHPSSENFMTRCWPAAPTPTSSAAAKAASSDDILHADIQMTHHNVVGSFEGPPQGNKDGSNSAAAEIPTVTPPFTIELVDDVPLTTLPTIAKSTAPKMKNSRNPFVLPIKKRFTSNAAAAAWQNQQYDDVVVPVTEVEQQQQPLLHADSSSSSSSSTNGGAVTTTTSAKETTPQKKKYRKPQCSHPSCPNRVMNRGVCARHGARVRTCSVANCTKYAQKGGVCIRHGAVKEYKRCVVSDCKSRPVGRGGMCARHAGCVGGSSGVLGKFCLLLPFLTSLHDEEYPL